MEDYSYILMNDKVEENDCVKLNSCKILIKEENEIFMCKYGKFDGNQEVQSITRLQLSDSEKTKILVSRNDLIEVVLY